MAEGGPTTMRVELVSPEQILYSGEGTMVLARTSSGGDIAFLPGHAPFLASLAPSVVKITLPGGAEQRAAVRGGFVEVSNNRVSVLSDEAELASDVDVDRARRDKDEAEARLRADHDDAAAMADLRWAEVRLGAAGASIASSH